MPGDRLEKLRKAHLIRFLRWREKGDHVVLCGQVPWDASVDNLDYMKWLQDTVDALRGTNRRVVFRPHPKAKLNPIPGFDYSTEPLLTDLQNAHCVIACNSNACVEGVIEGVPAIVADEGSMVWGIASRSLAELESPKMEDREQWAADLAYSQWTLDEFRSGEAWSHLSR
jgi:hypothetical protein